MHYMVCNIHYVLYTMRCAIFTMYNVIPALCTMKYYVFCVEHTFRRASVANLRGESLHEVM